MARLEDCALERAIAGEERPVVRGGKVVATWRRHDTALLIFLLRQRRGARYGTAVPAPGDPVYEALRAQWAEELEAEGAAARASLEAKVARWQEVMLERAREEARREIAQEREGASADFARDDGGVEGVF